MPPDTWRKLNAGDSETMEKKWGGGGVPLCGCQ
jgi:hypothetical protein